MPKPVVSPHTYLGSTALFHSHNPNNSNAAASTSTSGPTDTTIKQASLIGGKRKLKRSFHSLSIPPPLRARGTDSDPTSLTGGNLLFGESIAEETGGDQRLTMDVSTTRGLVGVILLLYLFLLTLSLSLCVCVCVCDICICIYRVGW